MNHSNSVAAPRVGSPPVPRLPQDLLIEILSYLNLSESNSLAHVNHAWLRASRVERRRVVELTEAMASKLEKRQSNPSFITTTIALTLKLKKQVNSTLSFATIIHSPLARLMTHLPASEPFRLLEDITTAHSNFPNLLDMSLVMAARISPHQHLLQRLQFPSRLTSITITHEDPYQAPIAHEEQQSYLDALSTASQLHTIKLYLMDQILNLTILTQLPQLTDLTLDPFHPPTFSGTTPSLPDEVLRVLNSLKQLVSLRLAWTMGPDQWSQLHLPLLQYISLASGDVSCSIDLIPLTKTIMVKSIRHLCLHLDVGADLTRLEELVKFTQLEKLEILRHSADEDEKPLTENDLRHIHAALSLLKTLTRLQLKGISLGCHEYIMNLSEVLASSLHLTSVDLHRNSYESSITDLSFLRTPLAHSRLVELSLSGEFDESDIMGGLFLCLHLRRLKVHNWARSTPNWWYPLKTQLDSRQVLPALNHIDLFNVASHGDRHQLWWDRWTGSKTHPTFRLKRAPMALEVIGTDALSCMTQFLEWKGLVPLSQVNHLFYQLLKRRSSYYQPHFPSFHRIGFNIVTYEAWLRLRSPIIIKPAQFWDYCHSHVMTHQTDVILHIDECLYEPNPFPPPTTAFAAYLSSSGANLDRFKVDLRQAVKRLQHLRALKILFRPTLDSFKRKCQCIRKLGQFNWSLALVEMFLEELGPQLISFEVEMDPYYDFLIPRPLISTRLHHLTSIEHVGILLPRVYDKLAWTESVRFPSADVGVLVFSRGHSQWMQTPGNDQRWQPLPTPNYSNASHCIWKTNTSEHVFEYLAETHEQSFQPFPYLRNQPHMLVPSIPFHRSQLRTLRLDPTYFYKRRHPHGDDELLVMQQELAMLVSNFSSSQSGQLHPTESSPEIGLQGLSIHDVFQREQLPNHQIDHLFIDYRPYLHAFRHQLRTLTFTTNCGQTQFGPTTEEDEIPRKINRPSKQWLPFFLGHDHDVPTEIDESGRVWTKLEVLNLSFMYWERFNGDTSLPPLDQATWIELGLTLPHLHTLSVSGRLLPLNQPCSGLLIQIKHLTLDVTGDISDQVHNPLVGNLINYVRVVVLQLRQLESFGLNLTCNLSWTAYHSKPYLTRSLIPLLVSSTHLRLVTIDFSSVVSSAMIDHQSEIVLFIYSLWERLQPSFVIPLDYSSPRQFLVPLVDSHDYDNSLLNQYVQEREQVRASSWFDRKLNGLKLNLKQWSQKLHHLTHDHASEKLRVMNERRAGLERIREKVRLQFHQFRTTLHAPTTSTSPSPPRTIQPRAFRFRLIPTGPPKPTNLSVHRI